MVNVDLLELDVSTLEDMRKSASLLEQKHNVEVGTLSEHLGEIAGMTLKLYEDLPRESPWGCYLAFDRESRAVVGSGGFKTAPTSEGNIEIAYTTFAPFENQGYGRAIATKLVNIACQNGIRKIIAQTLPEMNPSTRILQKLGFVLQGELFHLEDGIVWHWELLTETCPDPAEIM